MYLVDQIQGCRLSVLEKLKESKVVEIGEDCTLHKVNKLLEFELLGHLPWKEVPPEVAVSCSLLVDRLL